MAKLSSFELGGPRNGMDFVGLDLMAQRLEDCRACHHHLFPLSRIVSSLSTVISGQVSMHSFSLLLPLLCLGAAQGEALVSRALTRLPLLLCRFNILLKKN